MASEPPDINVGDVITAGWLNSLKAWIRSIVVSVARDSGLKVQGGGNGDLSFVIGFEQPQLNFLGITTSEITACSSDEIPGVGSVQPIRFDGTKLVNIGIPMEIRNWTSSTTAAGIKVKWVIIDGFPFQDGVDCGGGG